MNKAVQELVDDDERCRHLTKQLESLRKREVRIALLNHLAATHREATHERDAGYADKEGYERVEGMERPAIELVSPEEDEDRDPVPIVRGEVLVAAADAERAEAMLRDDFELQGPRLCGGIRKLIRKPERDALVPDALRMLADDGIRAGANHIAMLGGTDKGGASPMKTDTPLAFGGTSTDGPLVVVIDTGLDIAASGRGDGWLDGVRPDDPGRDIDLLDVLDIAGELNPDNKLDLGAGHGTFVAGVIRQVARNSDIVMLRALNTDGVGTEEWLAEAICRAAVLFRQAGGRGVLNISMGMHTNDNQEPLAVRVALDELPPEVLVVAAAGNSRTGIPWWPAASKRVLGVASHQGDWARTPSSWSNFGSWVDFSARGECVVSTFVEGEETSDDDENTPFGKYADTFVLPDPCALWSGTSFSTPQVAGELAYLLSINPNLTRAQAQNHLQQRGLMSKHHGYRLNVL
jgi:subtilisin family serine protease